MFAHHVSHVLHAKQSLFSVTLLQCCWQWNALRTAAVNPWNQ